MSDLTVAGFDEYFRNVHGYAPYPWQSRLTRQVLEEDGWPDVIDLPTGVGKTAVLDTAIFALAVRPDVSPRRVVFVIDRRIVVDQVCARAELIRNKISTAPDGVLADVRRCLGELSDAEEVLGVAALRGGIPVDGEWAQWPDQPWVIVSTVDQFGSRLLFRGYGVSPGMRPVYAGLAGNDCLVILDEVHLSRAFAATVREISSDQQIPRIRSANHKLLPRRFKVLEMSATPAGQGGRRFELQDEDLDQSTMLKQVADAQKRLKLVAVSGNRPPHESVPKKVVELISKELRDDERSVGVIVNRVRTARETHKALREAGMTAHLVTGRMRPIDRGHVLNEIARCVDPDRESQLAERSVIVATQAIEVGADFSFDALISEAAPTDSLFQRLGRLDRRGRLAAKRQSPARCWVLGVASALKRPDPVYGDAAQKTWEQLAELSDNGEVAAGHRAGLLARLAEETQETQAPKPEAPLVLPTHVEAWSQTRPEPVADPPIAEFLHGKESGHEPDVSVVWRLDLSADPDEQVTAPSLGLVPPRPAEFLSVPVTAFKNWVQGRVEVPVADVDLVPAREEQRSRVPVRPAVDGRLSQIVKWRGRGEGLPKRLEHLDEIEPGDVFAVPCSWGGLRCGTWDPSEPPGSRSNSSGDGQEVLPVSDLGDEAQIAHEPRAAAGGEAEQSRRPRATLRLDARLLDSLATAPPNPAEESDADKDSETRIRDWLEEVNDEDLPEWLSTAVARFRNTASFEIHLQRPLDAADYYVLRERKVDLVHLDGLGDEPSMTGANIRLKDHLAGVGQKALEYGERLGLSESIRQDLRLAGDLHDLGKIDSRFQAQLHGHDPVSIAESAEPLAKSLRGARTRRNSWPPVRHEFCSVALAQSNPAILEEAHDPDLVLHLVGTHHGFGRPLPQIREDTEPQPLEIVGQYRDEGFRLCPADEQQQVEDGRSLVSMRTSSDLAETPLALDMADRFWRLQQRYGHHGLAWLEAILRLADHQQSAEETRRG